MQDSTTITSYSFEVPSSRPNQPPYQVVIYTDGTQYCPCKGYGYRGQCSHIKAALLQIKNLTDHPTLPANHAILQAVRQCLTPGCGTQLVGTHHNLDKCASCYMKEAKAFLS